MDIHFQESFIKIVSVKNFSSFLIQSSNYVKYEKPKKDGFWIKLQNLTSKGYIHTHTYAYLYIYSYVCIRLFLKTMEEETLKILLNAYIQEKMK